MGVLEQQKSPVSEHRAGEGKMNTDVIFDAVHVDEAVVLTTSMRQGQRKQQQLRLLVPLFISFFGHQKNAQDNQTYTKYTKAEAKRQGKLFKKVAGKSNANDIFSKIIGDRHYLSPPPSLPHQGGGN